MEQVTRTLDRQAVRALAEGNTAELRQFAQAGGNVYQKSLEQSDKVRAHAAQLSDEDAAAFLNMYAEELDACTNKTLDDTRAIQQNAENMGQIVGGVIAAIVIIIFLAIVFK
ncbi:MULTISPECIES: hypothetical protein [Pseudomonas]|uniref:Uncharacterized protein n=1 Tax=Pseudomonas fragi TaxID=296 RepID=A0A9Q5FT02_PSEFR|nr:MULTISPECIES: hypothetical protein [Pseudomonas]MBM1181197.1 hypothetical protein [Pseudomonas lundensis]NNB51939.1 hypothetical protein [Pseudomonas fragi]WRU61686.1 hypothetical protein VPH48_26270 [Pseudomonas veronii]